MAITLIGCALKPREAREENLAGVDSIGWGWAEIKKATTPKMSKEEGELKVHKIARELGIQFAANKVLTSAEFEKLTTAAEKEFGGADRAKNYIFNALSRYGMGFSLAGGGIYQPPRSRIT
jgi:hypothetical protein